MNFTKIVSEIKTAALTRVIDPHHDLSHLYECWKNSFHIIKNSNIEVDQDVVLVAAWGHGAGFTTDQSEYKQLAEIFEKNGVEKVVQEKILNTILEHYFTAKQTSNESKVLFDADKLEHISVPRWEITLRAYKDGLIGRDKIKYYEELQNQLLADVSSRLYFDYSKTVYKIRLQEWYEFAQNSSIIVGGRVSINF